MLHNAIFFSLLSLPPTCYSQALMVITISFKVRTSNGVLHYYIAIYVYTSQYVLFVVIRSAEIPSHSQHYFLDKEIRSIQQTQHIIDRENVTAATGLGA